MQADLRFHIWWYGPVQVRMAGPEPSCNPDSSGVPVNNLWSSLDLWNFSWHSMPYTSVPNDRPQTVLQHQNWSWLSTSSVLSFYSCSPMSWCRKTTSTTFLLFPSRKTGLRGHDLPTIIWLVNSRGQTWLIVHGALLPLVHSAGVRKCIVAHPQIAS